MQQFLSSRTQQLSGPGDELSRNLLAQLQQGQPPSANIAQSLQAAQSQMNKMPRPFTDMERLMLERQLQGSRDSQVSYFPSLRSSSSSPYHLAMSVELVALAIRVKARANQFQLLLC